MEYGATTLNLASIIEHHARLAPDKEAIVWNEMRFTYGQLNASVEPRGECSDVEMGIGHGDKVALPVRICRFFRLFITAIMKAGAAVVPFAFFLSRAKSLIICAIRTRKRFLFLKERRNCRSRRLSKKVSTRSKRAKIWS